MTFRTAKVNVCNFLKKQCPSCPQSLKRTHLLEHHKLILGGRTLVDFIFIPVGGEREIEHLISNLESEPKNGLEMVTLSVAFLQQTTCHLRHESLLN